MWSWRLATVGLAALATALAAVALLPAGDERSGSPAPFLATASAAEVLNATAMNARSALPPVGPNEYLFTQASRTIGGEGGGSVDTNSWTATDGSARIVDCERANRLVRGTRGEILRRWRTDIAITTYRAGSDVGVVTENGVERRMPPPQVSPNWRHVVPGDEVVRLPAERDALLASLRARAERAAHVYPQPRPEGY